MSDYVQMVQTLRQEAAHQAPQLRNPACRPVFLLHPQPTTKVCLLFHGFTAAPYQFGPMAQTLFKAGYNVLVPVLPGHGLVGDWGPFTPPPLPEEAEIYQTFAQHWLQRARSLGQQLVVGGLSGGATLAAWLSLEQPEAIAKTLLFAPYFSSSQPIERFTRLINRYQEWRRPPLNLELSGYSGFETPALQLFLDMGEAILRRSQHKNAPSTFIVSSPSARESPEMEHHQYFERVLRYQPHTWSLCFEPVHDISYAMMTPSEDGKSEFLLTRLAKGYIESQLTWAEVAAIGNRMARGQIFPAAVAQLGLGERVSPDMATVMAMIDKRQFLSQQQRKNPTVNPYPLR